nr:immunoglobulin heavy chain junction region [Macaca mulatta]MOW78990.1 immunoglobulin heavy chain junction region [Macaca mulatta]MOW79679.1 immunoglobulin heavy chain junction region [Macaca mulatta]MOW79781.1 immunoglobulin heavy chain junction region [Macaca mulatta]MOW86276.1 immunoglobulin heavy chain junction region [Macaca mulatta]
CARDQDSYIYYYYFDFW